MRKKKADSVIKLENFDVKMIRGIRRAISISKIRNIILSKKNWILNGGRLRDKGSNPHSNGEDFSKFFIIFFEIKSLRRVRIVGTIVIKVLRTHIVKIIYIRVF